MTAPRVSSVPNDGGAVVSSKVNKRKLGRPCEYDPAKLPEVYKLAYEEQTDKTIARQVFGVTPSQFCRWKAEFPQLAQELVGARLDWARDTYALAKRSFRLLVEGGAIIAGGTNKDGSEWQKIAPPDASMVKFALVNLGDEAEGQKWADTTRHEHSGSVSWTFADLVAKQGASE